MHREKSRASAATLLAFALLVSATPARAQSQHGDDPFARLLKLAKERDKVLAKRQKELNKRLFGVSNDIMKTYRKWRKPEEQGLRNAVADAYAREGDAFVMLERTIGRERGIIERIFQTDRHTESDRSRIRGSMRSGSHAAALKRHNEEASRKAAEARLRLEGAQSKGAPPEVVELVRRELVAYQSVFTALDEEEEMLDRYLALYGGTSVGEIQKKQEERAEAERSKYRRLARERERASEYAAALIVGLGVLAALLLILKSPDSTPAEVEYAKQRMNELKEQQRTACTHRGGIFFDGGPYAIGTCSK